MTAYQYQYDLAGRASQVDNAGSVVPEVTLSMAYDYEGNRTWLGDNLGGGISYAWNNQRLQSMVMYTENYYKSAQVGFGYDSVGRLDSLTRTTNGNYYTTINTGYTLDLLDRVTSITHSKVIGEDASLLSQFTYGYDASGRVTNYTGPEGSLSFALDANGQLLSVTGSRSENYSFDATGNHSSSTATGNLLLNDGKYSYTYDLEGNQKTKTRISDGQMTEFFWDYRNQLTKAMVKDANGVLLKELRFTYDVEGRRVGVWVDADGAGPEEPDQVWTVFDGVNPYMDFDGDGELQTRYLYGPGIDELFARIGTGEEDPQWYLADRLGSVRQIVGASGAVLDEISYDSFGGILSESNPSQGDRFKFTGREYSPELGIYYYRARWYDPGSGRFISQDPIGFSAGDVNLYRYVGNAPGDATDPEGLSPWDYFQPWAAVQGLWEGGVNIGTGLYNFGSETALGAIDIGNSSVAVVLGERFSYRGYLTATGQALQNGQLTAGEYYYDFGANVLTFGAYGEWLALSELYKGQITSDQASQRLGTAGVMQLCGARVMRGNGPRGTSIQSPQISAPTLQPRIIFGHGGRHLNGGSLSQAAVESAIANVVRATPNAASHFSWIQVNGQWIQYRVHVLPDGSINIGTYFHALGNLSNVKVP